MLEVKSYVGVLKLNASQALKEKARERDNPRNIAQTSGYGKDIRTYKKQKRQVTLTDIIIFASRNQL